MPDHFHCAILPWLLAGPLFEIQRQFYEVFSSFSSSLSRFLILRYPIQENIDTSGMGHPQTLPRLVRIFTQGPLWRVSRELAATGPFPEVKLSCEVSGKCLYQATFLDVLMLLVYAPKQGLWERLFCRFQGWVMSLIHQTKIFLAYPTWRVKLPKATKPWEECQ